MLGLCLACLAQLDCAIARQLGTIADDWRRQFQAELPAMCQIFAICQVFAMCQISIRSQLLAGSQLFESWFFCKNRNVIPLLPDRICLLVAKRPLLVKKRHIS